MQIDPHVLGQRAPRDANLPRPPFSTWPSAQLFPAHSEQRFLPEGGRRRCPLPQVGLPGCQVPVMDLSSWMLSAPQGRGFLLWTSHPILSTLTCVWRIRKWVVGFFLFPHIKSSHPKFSVLGLKQKQRPAPLKMRVRRGFCLDHKERWLCGPASSSILPKQSAAITGWLHSLTPTQPGAGCGLCDG